MTPNPIVERLRQWPRGALQAGGPLHEAGRSALELAVGRPLPRDYLELLSHFDGLDLRGDRLLEASEVFERLGSVEHLLNESSMVEAWHHLSRRERAERAAALVPIALDAEGNLKCLDLDVGDVVDVHLETGAITGWCDSVSSLLLVSLDVLELRFDAKGRPRRLKAGEATQLERRELELQLERCATSAYAHLELSRWHTRCSPPELALQAWRAAARASDRPQIHMEYGLFALHRGRYEEARRALRGALKQPPGALRHAISNGARASLHTVLAELYRQVGQHKKAAEQKRAADGLRRAGAEGLDDDLESALLRLRNVAPPALAVPDQAEARGHGDNDDMPRRYGYGGDQPRGDRYTGTGDEGRAIAFDITQDDSELDPGFDEDQDSTHWGEDNT